MPKSLNQPEVKDMSNDSTITTEAAEFAPPLFGSVWLALFFAYKNGWRRSPQKQPVKNTSEHS